MKVNEDFQKCNSLIEKLQDRLIDTNSYVSIHGSAVYGLEYLSEPLPFKPNATSDIDLMVISEDLKFVDRLGDILDNDVLELDMYKTNLIDMIVFRAHKETRKISIECVKKEQYFRLCRASDPFIIVNKKLISKKGKVGTFYDYDIFSFIDQEKNTSRIIPYNESNIIIYPNQSHLKNGSFALTVFQDQILTQIDLIGDYQNKCRKFLIDNVINKAKIYKQNPLNLFRARLKYWSEDFKKYMESRLNDH